MISSYQQGMPRGDSKVSLSKGRWMKEGGDAGGGRAEGGIFGWSFDQRGAKTNEIGTERASREPS